MAFQKKAEPVKGGLGKQVGARLDRTLPVMFKRLKMTVQNAGTFSNVEHTFDGVYGTIATAKGSGSHSIIYKLDGNPEYNILWMTPARNDKENTIKEFVVEVSDKASSGFKPVRPKHKNSMVVPDKTKAQPSAHFHEFHPETARFIRVTFMKNFLDKANAFAVDDIWVARDRSTGPPN